MKYSMNSKFLLCYQNAFNNFRGLLKYAKVTILIVINLLNILYCCIHWIFDKASKFGTVVFFHHISHAWSVPIDEYMLNNLQVANQYVFPRIWSNLNMQALKLLRLGYCIIKKWEYLVRNRYIFLYFFQLNMHWSICLLFHVTIESTVYKETHKLKL